MRRFLNTSGYLLTPPAFLINLGEWVGKLTINQTFTIIISLFVVVFWVLKVRKEYYEMKLERKRFERFDG